MKEKIEYYNITAEDLSEIVHLSPSTILAKFQRVKEKCAEKGYNVVKEGRGKWARYTLTKVEV